MMVGDRAGILVVDDSAAMRRSLAEILSRAGHEVLQAADGVEASRVWRTEVLDLVILDLYMPEKDGVEAIGELRAFTPGIPIIAMSGGGLTGSGLHLLETAELLGAVLSIEKPFTADTMLETVRKALRGGTQGPA